MARAWIVGLSLLSNILGLALPLALIQVYDRILANQAIGTALILFAAVLVAIVLDGMTRFARSALFSRLGSVAEYNLSISVARQVLSMRRDQLKRFGAGHIEELFAAVSRSRDVLVGQSLLALFDAPFAIIFLILVWFLGGVVVVAPLAVVAVIGALALYAALRHSGAAADAFKARAAHKSLLMEGAARNEMFRTRGIAGELMARLRRTEIAAAEASERSERQAAALMDLTQVAGIAAAVSILAVGAHEALQGNMTTGAIAACLILGQRAVSALVGVVSGLARRQTAVAAHRQLRRALQTKRALPAHETVSRDDGPLGAEVTMPSGAHVSIKPGTLNVIEFATYDQADEAYERFSSALAAPGDGDTAQAALVLSDADGTPGAESGARHHAWGGAAPLPRHDPR